MYSWRRPYCLLVKLVKSNLSHLYILIFNVLICWFIRYIKDHSDCEATHLSSHFLNVYIFRSYVVRVIKVCFWLIYPCISLSNNRLVLSSAWHYHCQICSILVLVFLLYLFSSSFIPTSGSFILLVGESRTSCSGQRNLQPVSCELGEKQNMLPLRQSFSRPPKETDWYTWCHSHQRTHPSHSSLTVTA